MTHRAEAGFSSQEDRQVVAEAGEHLETAEKARHRDNLARWVTPSSRMHKDAASARR